MTCTGNVDVFGLGKLARRLLDEAPAAVEVVLAANDQERRQPGVTLGSDCDAPIVRFKPEQIVTGIPRSMSCARESAARADRGF